MKEIKDYLHLYLGCKAKWSVLGDDEWTDCSIDLKVLDRVYDRQPFEIKLILRHLSSMTEDEKSGLFHPNDNIGAGEAYLKVLRDTYYEGLTDANNNTRLRLGPSWYFKHVPYLLSKHFDLFGLIESGLAINATILK